MKTNNNQVKIQNMIKTISNIRKKYEVNKFKIMCKQLSKWLFLTLL